MKQLELSNVAAGAVAKALLATRGVSIVGGTVAVAEVEAQRRDWEVAESNAVRCPDAEAAPLVRAVGGLTIDETAAALGVSAPTVERGWRAARAWLFRDLSREP